MKIYQLQCFVNAFNKKKKCWESKYEFSKIYVGKEGLITAHSDYEREVNKFHYEHDVGNWTKYTEVRGKCELHEPHIHENGTIAYWGDKILLSDNPDNI